MDIMLLSIIVPIYNTQIYLSRCIESLYNQGLCEMDFEVILVNDGSTDGSLVLCERYACEHSNIRIITQHNQGLSLSRNIGILWAKGKYVCFVDSDDYLAADGLSKVIEYCDGQHDIIRCWCHMVYNDIKPKDIVNEGNVTFDGSGHDYLKKFGLETFCVNCLYKKEYLLTNNLFFCPNIYGEDIRFMADVLLRNPFVLSLSYSFYNYMIREGSISTNKDMVKNRKWVEDLLGTLTYINKKLAPFSTTDEVLFFKCHYSLQGRIPVLISRILAADYSKKEFKEITAHCRKETLLPIKIHHQKLSRKARLSYALCNFLCTFPLVYPCARFFYQRIFTRIIYPHFNRSL